MKLLQEICCRGVVAVELQHLMEEGSGFAGEAKTEGGLGAQEEGLHTIAASEVIAEVDEWPVLLQLFEAILRRLVGALP